MAGIPLTEQRRSQLLEQLLSQQTQRPQIQSVGELAARLGAQLIKQKQVEKLQDQEQSAQQKLLEALSVGQPTSGKVVALEDFEGGSGRQQIGIPGKKADPSASRAALSELPIQQRILAAQLKNLERKDVESFTLSPGQGRFIDGQQVASLPAEKSKRTKANFIDSATGQAHAGTFDGEFYRTSKGDIVTNAAPIAPAAGQKDIQNNRQSFRPVEAATANALGEIDNLIGQIAASPNPESLISVLGGATRGISAIANQARAAAGLFSGLKPGQSLKATIGGKTVNEQELFDLNLYDFGDMAAAGAGLQSNVLNLAYSIARIRDPGGRLSDRDVQSAVESITGGDVPQTLAKLKETRRRTVETFRNDAISRDLKNQLGSFEQRFGISLDVAGGLSPQDRQRLKALGVID